MPTMACGFCPSHGSWERKEIGPRQLRERTAIDFSYPPKPCAQSSHSGRVSKFQILAPRRKRVRILRASAHNIFLAPSIHDLVLCEFLLKERRLMGSIVDSFAFNLGPTAQGLIPVQASLSNSYIILCKPW